MKAVNIKYQDGQYQYDEDGTPTAEWNDDYFTPCTHTKVPVKVVFGEKEFVANGFITRTKLKATNNKGKTKVEGGVIHTFSKLNEAKKTNKRFDNVRWKRT